MNQSEIRVVIESDYAGGGEKYWKGLRAHPTTRSQESPPVNTFFGCWEAKSARHMDEGRTTYR